MESLDGIDFVDSGVVFGGSVSVDSVVMLDGIE